MNISANRFFCKVLANQRWNKAKTENDENIYNLFFEFFQGKIIVRIS